MQGRHACNKRKDDPTYSPQWSGVSFAPHCCGHCKDCGGRLHHEGGSHYCPRCDDFKPQPDCCRKEATR